MSAQTKDYVAHAKHLGRVQYDAQIVVWDDDDRHYLADRIFPNFGLAKSWAAKELPRHVSDAADVWVEIRRGKWERNEFDDIPGGYGRIHDAVWTEDDDWGCEGYPDDDGVIRWEEWS